MKRKYEASQDEVFGRDRIFPQSHIIRDRTEQYRIMNGKGMRNYSTLIPTNTRQAAGAIVVGGCVDFLNNAT